jgi:hypothetical protein
MSADEVRFVVDTYYEIQDYRIQAGGQARSLGRDGEPIALLDWIGRTMSGMEREIVRWMDTYTDASPVGVWAKSIVGIGPVLSAGVLAHIDIEKAPTVGHIWRFAGLDPTMTWERKQKRPWNARLKVLCWKMGESFIKVQANERDVYGKLYAQRKAQEQSRNGDLRFADQAKASLEGKNFGKETEARKWLEKGMLPPAQVHARARRFAVKMFLADLHHVMYECRYGTLPPKPWVVEHGGHVHVRPVPNHDCVGA